MKINARTHLEIRLQNLVFTLLFLGIVGVAGWLSTRYSTQFDWSAGARHSLSEASRKILDMMPGPVQVTAYAREEKALRQRLTDQVGRFSRYKKELELSFVNPDTQPDKVRELGISVDGELRIAYQGRNETVQDATETALANAFQRLIHAKDQHIVFLEGHGERNPKGQANHDYGQFGEELGRKGMTLTLINLAVTPAIPDNTDLLVLSGARTALLPGEVAIVQSYVAKGGNLLWLADPGDLHGLAPLAKELGLKFFNGTVVDASTQLFGIDDPTFALVAQYPPHAVTMGFQSMSLYPSAVAMDLDGDSSFERTPILDTLPRSWTETGPIEGKIAFDANHGEHQGPLHIGFALTRTKPDRPDPKAAAGKPDDAKNPKPSDAATPRPEQRIVVIGDGDFLSNSYLGNGGNLNLGLNLVHWLSQNEQFINIPARPASDRNLSLSPLASATIGLGFLIVFPVALIGTGAFIWFTRRRR